MRFFPALVARAHPTRRLLRTISSAVVVALGAFTMPAAALHAQDASTPSSARPPLARGADSNDISMYLLEGSRLLQRNPAKAASYFRWAAALDPQNPEAPYGERVAILLADRGRLLYYWRGDPKTRELPDIKRADSLQALALTRAPLFFRRYDRMLLTAFFEAAMQRTARSSGMSGEDESEMRYEMAKWLNSSEAPAYLRAWFAYSDGDFRKATQLYAEALAKARAGGRGELLAERARSFAHMGANDSAIAIFRASMAADSASDADRLVFALRSRAQMEHVLGALFEAKGDTAGAHAAYERALTEDLGYYPAHIALGAMAYERGDTAMARHELGEAVQVAGDDPAAHYTYGLVLATTGSVADGVNELLKAIQLAPQWPEPHLLLARLHDAADMREEAIPYWRNFLARAADRHPAHAMAVQRLSATAAR